jgi:hypothetical protein
MSIRSIVEFNHDYINELVEQGHISGELCRWLCDSRVRGESVLGVSGLRYLSQRHHSETIELKIQ